MTTINPFEWKLPSLLSIAKAWVAVAMVPMVFLALMKIIRGGDIGQAVMVIAISGIIFWMAARDRVDRLP